MEQAVTATQILANLGLLFLGIGMLWFVTIYKEKKEQKNKMVCDRCKLGVNWNRGIKSHWVCSGFNLTSFHSNPYVWVR